MPIINGPPFTDGQVLRVRDVAISATDDLQTQAGWSLTAWLDGCK